MDGSNENGNGSGNNNGYSGNNNGSASKYVHHHHPNTTSTNLHNPLNAIAIAAAAKEGLEPVVFLSGKDSPPQQNEPHVISSDQGSKEEGNQLHPAAAGDGTSSDGNNQVHSDPQNVDLVKKTATTLPPVVTKPIATVAGKGSNSGDAVVRSEDTHVMLQGLPPIHHHGQPNAINTATAFHAVASPHSLSLYTLMASQAKAEDKAGQGSMTFLPNSLQAGGHTSAPPVPGDTSSFSAPSLGMYHQLMMHYAKRGGALAQMQQTAFYQQLQWQQQMMQLAAAGASMSPMPNASYAMPNLATMASVSAGINSNTTKEIKPEDLSPIVLGTNAVLTQAEARALALEKYRNKRRNLKFGKTIRYESRKQLAQARPRVKGQFVSMSGFGARAADDMCEEEEDDEEEDEEEEELEDKTEPMAKKARRGCEGQNFNETGEFDLQGGGDQNMTMQCNGEDTGDGGGSGTNADPGGGAGEGRTVGAQSGSGRKRKPSGRSGSARVNAAALQLSGGNVEEEEDVVNSLIKLRQAGGAENAAEGKRGKEKEKNGSDSGSNSPSDENASGGDNGSGQGSGGDQ